MDDIARLTWALASALKTADFGELIRRNPECLSEKFRMDLLMHVELMRAHAETHEIVIHLKGLLALLDDCRAWGVAEVLASEFENNPAAALPAELAQCLGSLHRSPLSTVDTVAWDELLASPNVADCPPELRWVVRNSMGVRHLERYRTMRDARALDVAIKAYHEVVSDESAMSTGRLAAGNLSNLAAAHMERFLLTGDEDDLEIAVDHFREALGRMPRGASGRPPALVSAASALKERYRLSRDPLNLSEAIEMCIEAVGVPPLREDQLLGTYHILESTRLLRAHAGLALVDIDPLLQRIDFCLQYTPSYPSDQLAQLYFQLGNELLVWYRSTAESTIFDVVSRCYAAVAGHYETDPRLPLETLIGQGIAFSARYEALGDQADIDAAMSHFKRCSRQTPIGSELHLLADLNIAVCLVTRYQHVSDLQDLSSAMAILDEVTGQVGSDWPGRPTLLKALADVLHQRYLREGRVGDINQARALLREAVTLTPPDAAERPLRLVSLGVVSRTRFLNLGEIADLETAIDSLRSAATALYERDPSRVLALTSLATALIDRHGLSGPYEPDSADLDDAVEAAETAAREGSANPLRKFVLLTNLGQAVDARALAAGAAADYERSVSISEDALGIGGGLGANYAALAHHALGVSLHHRFTAVGDWADLDRAIDEIQRALDGLAADSPRRASWLRSLGMAYYDRWVHHVRAEDVTSGVVALRSSCELGLAAEPRAALEAAKRWGTWASERKAWPEAAEAFGQAIEAIGLLFRAQQARAHKELWLTRAQGIPARAGYAMAKAGNLEAAVLAVETGQATLAAETLNTGELELEFLSAQRPDLARRYRAAAAAITAAIADPHSANPTTFDPDAIGRAREELAEVIREIRHVDGFRYFRAETSIGDLVRQAPLLYLAYVDETGYALLVDRDGTLGFRLLPQLSAGVVESRLMAYFTAYYGRRQNPQEWLSELDDLTVWLGQAIFAPLLADLHDRVVLIPSGHLAALPLHAALTTNIAGTRHYIMGDIRFTYTASARVLAASRRRLANRTTDDTLGSALVVANPTRAGRPLPNAAREANAVAESFETALILTGAQATRARVLDEVPRHDILHFACHGNADIVNPLDSGLTLADGEHFTVDDVLRIRLDVRLAVFSACETALPGAVLPDEVVALPTGMVQAGTIGVIGSLWSVSDAATAELMIRFYTAWRGGMEPAEALRQAQQSVRDDPDHAWSHPHYWAAFGYHGL